jgi:hypothetical protein
MKILTWSIDSTQSRSVASDPMARSCDGVGTQMSWPWLGTRLVSAALPSGLRADAIFATTVPSFLMELRLLISTPFSPNKRPSS